MIRCQITSGGSDALASVERAIAAGVDYIQVREKHLPARQLATLVRGIVRLARNTSTRILVNDRADIAVACGAQGVHLPGDSIAPSALRRILPQTFLISVACHTIPELLRAEQEAADFALYAPVFAPLSKNYAGPVVGLDGLSQACHAVRLPVLALGGITAQNAPSCLQAGAAGIAAITLFR